MKRHSSVLSRSNHVSAFLLPAVLIAAAVLLSLGLSSAQAQTLGFDPGLTGVSPGSGGSGIWESGSADWVPITGSGDIPWDNGALYGSLFTSSTTLFNNSGGFYMNTYAGGGFNSYDTRRRGLLADATGATNGAEFNTFLGAGYDVHVGGLTFGPIASVEYTYVDFNGFTERGSVAPLRIVSQNQDSLRTNAGIKLAYPFTAGGMVITPQLRASWQHEFAYSATPVYSEFNDTSDAFKVFGPKIGRDSALIEAGFRVQLTRTVATFLNYDGKINPDYTAHAVNGGVDVSF